MHKTAIMDSNDSRHSMDESGRKMDHMAMGDAEGCHELPGVHEHVRVV